MSDATATLRIKTVMDSSDAISNIGQLQKRLESLKLPKNLTEKAQAGFDELKKTAREYQELIDKPKKSNADLNRIDQLGSQMKKQFADVEKYIRNIDFSKIDYSELDSPKLDEVRNKIEEIINACKRLAKDAFQGAGLTNDLNKPIGKLKELQDIADKMTARKGKRLFEGLIGDIKTGDIDAVVAKVKEIQTYMNQQKGASKQFKEYAEAKPVIEALLDTFREMKPSLDEINSYAGQAAREIDHLGEEFNEVGRAELDRVGAEMREIGDYTNQAAHATNTWANSLGTAAHKQTEMQQQVQNLQQQIKNYFGLDEVFRKIGDLAREAMDTVKELDAAMTETAVVTNFSVSDMWDMLPTYTKNANALGSTIADVYNAATLYYQQGLTTSQSMALANETLKMARIGGIEAAEATDMMTAALRGFNMEINQGSAQKINDVYSKLAAITAADTKEIGSAMERTASIASSANMDFETTSAFLSQMIETTREAPENLGTAMKTIIARFQEMKQDPNSLIDSEGQAMDFNRVDKALKTIGVSLTNEKNEFRDLDDVFLEISSRWDGLTQAQQRYIATIAAGSRQQSRFIAMMQDYDRTLELVDAAYTAEGAGQAQFEKTLESMDSKLNKLKNAWDQFVMGLMNADFLKKGVDIATGFLSVFEKIIDTVSKVGIIDPFQGIIKSALTATAVFGGLLGMSKLLMAAVGKFAGSVLGDEVNNLNTPLGALAKKQNAKTQEHRENLAALTEQNKRRQLQSRQEFYNAAQQTNGGFVKSMWEGKKAQRAFNKASRINLKGINIGPQLEREFMAAASRAKLDEAGMKAAQEFIQGINKGLESGDINAKEAIEQVKAEAAKGYSNEEGINTPLSVDFTSTGLDNASNAFDKIGASAQNAGSKISSFGMTLYGTPLQPFGQALDLVGRGLTAIGDLSSGASTALKAFQGAMVLGTTATSANTSALIANEAARIAEAEGISIFAAAQKLANLGQEEGAAAAYAAALGLETEAAAAFTTAAGEAAVAAGSTGVIAGIKGITAALLTSPLMPFVVALMATAAAAAIVYKLVTADQKAFERQGDAAAQASQDLDTTKQALEAVINDLDELNQNDEALDGLIKGTTEWNNKLAEANAHIIEMMQHYKTLNEMDENGEYKYVKTDEDGRMSITKAGQEAIRKEYQNAVNLATANNAVQGALYNNMKDKRSAEYKENQKIIASRNVGSDEYKQALLQNKNIEQANEARLENAWKTGIHAAISDKGFTDTSAIEKILTDQREDLVSAVTLGSKKENKQSYADLMDYEWVKKDTYKDAQGNELEIDYDTVKEMLPELQGLKEAQNRASEVQQGLISAQNSYNEAIKASGNESLYVTGKQAKEDSKLTKGIQEGQASIISDILSASADADINAVDAFINAEKGKKSGLDIFLDQFQKNNEENRKTLSQLTGEDVTKDNYKSILADFEAQLRKNADAMFEQQTEAIQGAAGILDASNWQQGAKEVTEQQSDAEIKNILDQMTQSQISMMNETSEAMSDNLNSNIAQSYATTVANLVKEGKNDVATEFQESLANVDWSSGISSLEGVNKALEKGGKDVKEFGDEWEKNGAKAMATSTALQEVFSSDDFMDIEEDLMKTSKEMGGLDASAIMEAAESSSTLQRYLDATGGSAEGVARAFNLIHDQDLGIDLTDLTPSVVAAANAMEQLSVSAGRADKMIENLEIKNDTGKYADAIDSQKEAIDEMIKNGEYGNEGVEQVLKQTFGPEKWAEAYGDGKKGIQELYKKYTEVAKTSASDIASLYKKGDSVDKMITKIADHYKVSEEYADILLQKATNVNVGLKRSLERADLSGMVEAAMTASGMEVYQKDGKGHKKGQVKSESGGVTSTGELATQALMYGGDDVVKQQEYLTKYAGQLGVDAKKLDDIFKSGSVKDWTNKIADLSTGHIAKFDSKADGQQVNAALYDEWKTRTKATQGSWWQESTAVEGEKDTYDLKKYVEKAMASGANQQQAMDAAYYVAQKHIKAGKNFEIAGQEVTKEDLVDPSTFYAKYQEAIDNAQWTKVGETIGSEIVKALQGAHFMESMTDSGVMDKELYSSKNDLNGNNISESAIDSVWREAQENSTNRGLQLEALNTYLSDQKAAFEKLSPEQQIQATNTLVQKLDSLDFNKEEIATAIAKATGRETNEKTITGEDGSYKIDWTSTGDLKTLYESVKTSVQESATEGMQDLKGTGTVYINDVILGGGTLGKTNKGGAKQYRGSTARGQNNYHLGTFARGSRSGYTIPGRPTLTGEEGEELVWEPKQNAAYMVGTNGPQFANISRDAVVWNADQTKRIKKNSNTSNFGLGARGIRPVGSMALGAPPQKRSSGGGGGASISGQLSIDAVANITDIKEPEPPKTIPVYADVKVKGEEKGGLWGKIKSLVGGKDGSKTIPVTAQITKTVNKTRKTVKGVKATATVTQVRKAGTVKGEPVSVKANATVNTVAKTDSASGAISNLASKANSTQTMTVKANTNAAETKVRNLVNSINSQKASVKVSASPDSLSVPVKLVYDGSWSKTITFKKAAEGMNYKKYNSYASGTPKAKGGLTLTGEEGYEVVWMPGQKQSMIVGVNGPQMLELPPDAVVWPHEQSKKILKNNKGIPAQSYAKGSKERKTAKKGYKAGIYTTEKREAGFFKWIASIENSEKKIEKWGKSLDKASDAAERYAKQVGGNSKTLFNKEVSKQFSLLSKQLKAANSELKLAGKATNAINKSRKKTTISYNLDSAKDSPSKEFYVKEGALVNRNKNGELTINEKGIRKTARKRGKTAFQVNQIITEMRSAAQSLVDEYNGHLESAKDLQDEVKQKQQELRDSIKETFYEFEHDLDRIKKLQSNITLFDSFESRISAIQSYLDSKMKAGFATSKQVIGQYTKFLEQQADNLLDKITAQRDLTNLATATLSNDTKTYDEYKAWKNAQSATAKAKKYGVNSSQYQKALAEEEYRKQEYDKVVLGSKYVKVGKDNNTGQITVTLNEDALAKANLKSEDYQAVKDYYENILQKVQDINQGVADVHSGIASAYDQITSAYTDVDNFAKNVINGMQESEQETIDSLKTLNDSLRDAFSDLIDSVRKELDKQRKAEQNQKTEKDITDRMNRLAMLRADTSGSNAAEIAQLEKEITEATGDYEDSLEDQLLDRLQDDADKAAEQRERQINILEEQLEYTKAIGQYVTRAENLVQKYINETATAAEEAELRSYYMLGANGKDPMTKWGKKLVEGEFESAATKVKTFNDTIEKLTNTIKSLEEILAGINANPTIGDTKAQEAEQLAGQMKEAGKSAKEVYSALKEKGLSDSQIAKEMRKAGYTGAQAASVKDLSAKELREGGYSAKDLAGSKAAKTLLKAGYTYKEIAPYYGQKELQKAAADTGTTTKAKDFGGGKTKLAGTAKTVKTYKNKKGKTVDIKDTTGTFTEGGNVAFAKGSQVWYKNSKTGKVTKKYPLNKFTKAQISPKNAEYKEFAQAIKFAMTNNKVGSKVPGLVTALKTAISTGAWKKAGYNKGWDLKGVKVKGSAGSNGLIYYNSGDAVKTWNPSTGNINTIKYNKADFAKKAASTYVGREYANAREYHKKKYKKYLSGGLANYTGPAWMDGTPSKPELVLNATDTKNFIALKDILSEAAKRGAFSRKEENVSQGDMTFDININVDKINSDYDVDKVAKRVEKIITTKAKTRNVTVVGRSR